MLFLRGVKVQIFEEVKTFVNRHSNNLLDVLSSHTDIFRLLVEPASVADGAGCLPLVAGEQDAVLDFIAVLLQPLEEIVQSVEILVAAP